MAKFLDDSVLEAALNEIKNNADTLILCEGQPSTYADATTLKSGGGNKLGDVAVASGDFTITDGDTSGRKISAFTKNITPDEGGSADHVAIVDDNNSVLLHVDTMTATSVSSGEQQSVEVGDIEVEDPS